MSDKMKTYPMDDAYSNFVCNANKTGWASRDFFDAGWQAALSQSEPEVSQSVAVMWQNEETGNTGFVDLFQVENGFFKNNLRLKQVCFCYSSPPDYEALKEENEELKDDLQFVERWANHHAVKPNISAQEALSCIQHYPSIRAITKSYKDGTIPTTRNPYAENEALKLRVAELEEQCRTIHEQVMAMINLKLNAEDERDRLQSEFDALKSKLYGSAAK